MIVVDFFTNKEQEGFSLINNQYRFLVIVIKNKESWKPIFDNAQGYAWAHKNLRLENQNCANGFILVFGGKYR